MPDGFANLRLPTSIAIVCSKGGAGSTALTRALHVAAKREGMTAGVLHLGEGDPRWEKARQAGESVLTVKNFVSSDTEKKYFCVSKDIVIIDVSREKFTNKSIMYRLAKQVDLVLVTTQKSDINISCAQETYSYFSNFNQNVRCVLTNVSEKAEFAEAIYSIMLFCNHIAPMPFYYEGDLDRRELIVNPRISYRNIALCNHLLKIACDVRTPRYRRNGNPVSVSLGQSS